MIGTYCNISNVQCNIRQPCLNNGICYPSETDTRGYTCSCLSRFTGNHCEIENRPCQPNTCFGHGIQVLV